MELRRAILLFAVVLAIAAVVTVLSGGSQRRDDDTTPAPAPPVPSPTARAAPGTDSVGEPTITVDADRAPGTEALPAGRAATLRVQSDEPGTVTIPDLGLTAEVEPGTPAAFAVLADRTSGSLPVLLTPSGENTARTIAHLRVRPQPTRD